MSYVIQVGASAAIIYATGAQDFLPMILVYTIIGCTFEYARYCCAASRAN